MMLYVLLLLLPLASAQPIVAPAAPCSVNTLTATDVACMCGTDECTAGQYCYAGGCHAVPEFDPCPANAYDPVVHKCGCAETDICNPGRFCFEGSCNVNAHCTRPDNIDKGVFYGAKIIGHWDQPTKTMDMRLPIPGYFTLDTVSWVDAQDPSILKYEGTNHGSWTVDNSDVCLPEYILNVNQAVFFGAGSRFSVTGHQMKAAIDVDVHTSITRVHQGHSYVRDRHVSNMLPVMVNLVPVTTVSVIFHTLFGSSTPVPCGATKAVIVLLACEDVDLTTINEECQTTYGTPHGLTCEYAECSHDDFVKQNFIGAEDGSDQDEIDALVAQILADGWSTSTYTADTKEADCEVLEPEEFVIFLEAHDNLLIEDMGTITILMETHSRGCVDHAGTVNKGAHVAPDSMAWIDEAAHAQEWIWTPFSDVGAEEEAEIEWYTDWNLCVETVEWTFAPVVKGEGTYEVELVFEQKGELPDFSAIAEITIAKSDVLGDIGFDTTIELYEDVDSAGVPFNPSNEFQIGERFWSKIALTNLVVDTDTIECTEYTVTQFPEEADIGIDPALDGGVHDMLNIDVYKFEKRATTLVNTAVFGAELDINTFYLSVAGVQSVLDVGLEVTYAQGEQENIRLRRVLQGNKWVETAMSEDDDIDFASMEREPEQQSLSVSFGILGREENLVGIVFRKMASNSRSSGAFILFGMALVGGYMKFFSNKGQDSYTHLIAEEF